MSVASHLAVSPTGYDRRIRQYLPHYDELIAEAALALGYSLRRIRLIVDLGVGTAALSRACLEQVPAARVWGIDEDPAMLALARVRFGRRASRATLVEGSFLSTLIPSCDAIVATYALHHIRSTRAKQAFYARCFRALRPGGVLVSGDCAPASTDHGFAQELDAWIAHMAPSCGGTSAARRVYQSWGDEDTYLPLATEQRLLAKAGFRVDVPWRRSPFAVMVGVKPAWRAVTGRRHPQAPERNRHDR
jgi:ubiquinone/menaquinone biosynthesis C-methylase UbiE